jgi:small neutral amino acid transporter SnatA (MarC family)
MAKDSPRTLAQNVAAIITLIVVIGLVVMSALGPLILKHDIAFPPAAYALMGGVLYFIFGFRMNELNDIIGKLLSQAARQATKQMSDDAGVTEEDEEPPTEPEGEGAHA